MDALRSNLRSPNDAIGDTFVVTQATGGFFTAADALAGRNQRTTVQPGSYHVFNRSQGMVNVTTVQGVPGGWINPTGQGKGQIRVGSRVRVNNDAQNWVTSQLIPA